MSEERDWYGKQEDDAATLGEAVAERKWHGLRRDPKRAALGELNASFDEIVRRHREGQ